MKHYQFFQNRNCEYFPCHRNIPEEQFNCLFCYCPLYALGDQCGGCFRYTAGGIKDCTGCIRPHLAANYDEIVSSMNKILELAKRKDREPEIP